MTCADVIPGCDGMNRDVGLVRLDQITPIVHECFHGVAIGRPVFTLKTH